MTKYLPTEYQQYIHLSRYARWLPEQGRRETWEETVDRYFNFFCRYFSTEDLPVWESCIQSVLSLETMPSMRALMTAGPALERDNVAGYNCSYRAIDGTVTSKEVYIDDIDDVITVGVHKPIDFDEIMYILMCGTGVGFSVERQYISNLPTVGNKLSRQIYRRNNKNFPGVQKEELSVYDTKTNTIHVTDSKYGWSSALRILIVELYNGNFDIDFDLSKIRAAGEPLRIFGGRASGPTPLYNLFTFTKEIFKKSNGKKLSSIDVHDIVCKIAEVVVVGGVRRSALISLSNLTDTRMAKAKSGQEWYKEEPQRQLANNSVCYTETPDMSSFLQEWGNLYESRSGERGIFNRISAQQKAGANGRRSSEYEFGTNPCSEIILRNKQFCNLSEVIVRPFDTFLDLKRKVRVATILGTLQSTLTNFVYLSPEWQKNCEEERLLGVSLTGIMDHPVLNGSWYLANGEGTIKDWLRGLRDVAIETNKEWAQKLGINQSTAITCVKPSGTVSQLVDSSSGIHARHSPFYIRTVRGDIKDPLTQFLMSSGVPNEPAIGNSSTIVFSFPIKAPDNSVVSMNRTALEQLELWKLYAEEWCEHKPSVTITVKEDEWVDVAAWVYRNFNEISGVSFLPYDDHVYPQAPYQQITEEEYDELAKRMPTIDWSKLKEFELEDTTTATHELACSAGGCEI